MRRTRRRLVLRVLALVVVLIGVLLLVTSNDDDDEDGDETAGLTVVDPWVRATVLTAEMETESDAEGDAEMEMDADASTAGAESGGTTAAFMTIQNAGEADDRLIAAAVDASIAAVVELHETTMDGDVMRMQPVEGGILVPAGGSVELKPRGLHIMLMGVQATLNEGDTVSLTLTFESGTTLTVDAPVRPLS
jgi:copper(I)-binding protein